MKKIIIALVASTIFASCNSNTEQQEENTTTTATLPSDLQRVGRKGKIKKQTVKVYTSFKQEGEQYIPDNPNENNYVITYYNKDGNVTKQEQYRNGELSEITDNKREDGHVTQIEVKNAAGVIITYGQIAYEDEQHYTATIYDSNGKALSTNTRTLNDDYQTIAEASNFHKRETGAPSKSTMLMDNYYDDAGQLIKKTMKGTDGTDTTEIVMTQSFETIRKDDNGNPTLQILKYTGHQNAEMLMEINYEYYE